MAKAGKGGNVFAAGAPATSGLASVEFLREATTASRSAIRAKATLPTVSFEVQVLDDSAPHQALQEYQYRGSVYGLVPSHRGYQRPQGEWNFEEVTVRGSHFLVMLNGAPIVIATPRGSSRT